MKEGSQKPLKLKKFEVESVIIHLLDICFIEDIFNPDGGGGFECASTFLEIEGFSQRFWVI